ncbi:MAG: hypothetical protein M3N34_08220 [Pseudomonadota bacterium]|nr:hypothetical protein [Pseudomonadota bacterium]
MDSNRGILVEHERSDADAPSYDHAARDEDIGEELPPVPVRQNERRMQVRAYNLWTSLLGAREFPGIADLTRTGIPDFAGNAVLLDFSDGTEIPAVTMLGQKLAEECGASGAIERLSDIPTSSLLARITDRYGEILVNRAPIGFDTEFVNQRGKTLLCRGLLLPFSGDGVRIAHIMGVINWKEMADATATATAGLIRELEIAARDKVPETPPQHEWADGPAMAELFDLGGAPFAEFDYGAGASAAWIPADWLASARELAQGAEALQDRSRAALYAAIGRAWDFALAAEAEPRAIGEIAARAGEIAVPSRIGGQAGGSLMPVVKLVFGADCGKDRLTEYAMVLACARRRGLGMGELADFLAGIPGGLKGVVSQERKLRRAEAEQQPASTRRSG